MEKTNNFEAEYQKGFNDGYIISKFEPEIAKHLAKASGDSIRLTGFRDGREQVISERFKEKRPSWLTGDRIPKDVPDHNMDKDIEHDR